MVKPSGRTVATPLVRSRIIRREINHPAPGVSGGRLDAGGGEGGTYETDPDILAAPPPDSPPDVDPVEPVVAPAPSPLELDEPLLVVVLDESLVVPPLLCDLS